MMWQGVLAGGALAVLAACAGVSDSDPSLDQAALLTASCSGCHAASGRAGGIASLSGMSSADIETRLLAYRQNEEGGSSMHRMARGYSEQQIALIAERLGQ